ncbi:5-bromo-4-chloroindolyl phosphate hydrolysis family protein [Jeotgalibacillus haloalkalitolerans]|uniref:5-bromo-4-chloroindolyl phosphate hydrolysis family protein n=1 Tax=Jeotgalibacillus haloalkalitolerans TaxID=3104292 RepID=A0ABU5KKV1_9BACL|nr:5-bromo-4-chloroindolyl phosphate hydrolysis family protein [Jeotgalibacillus sp. HH7-29]MDZ5711894.1 5-bromo-4-chloroindolyl phosphate hydrolysis family protein [Jeotgalibacillus sp. HH7-29]
MKQILNFVTRLGISLPIASITWISAIFLMNVSFWPSLAAALIGGIVPFYTIKWFQKRSLLKSYGLTKREYEYIQSNLKEAQKKISRLQGKQFQIRSISAMRQLNDMIKFSRRIFSIVKKDPKRFYTSERFFFYHLDSAVELTEKYTMLVTQPVKNKEVLVSLEDTRQTLHELNRSLEEDLMKVLSNDLDTLRIELDMAKNTIEHK